MRESIISNVSWGTLGEKTCVTREARSRTLPYHISDTWVLSQRRFYELQGILEFCADRRIEGLPFSLTDSILCEQRRLREGYVDVVQTVPCPPFAWEFSFYSKWLDAFRNELYTFLGRIQAAAERASVFAITFYDALFVSYIRTCWTYSTLYTARTLYLRTCAPVEDSDQPAHSRSLIRIFTGAVGIARDANFLYADNEDKSDCANAQADLFSLGAHVRLYVFSRCVSFHSESTIAHNNRICRV